MLRPRLFWFAAAAMTALASTALAEPQTSVSEVVVTGAPYAVSIDSVTTSVEVMTRRQLDTAPALGIGDLLADLPGIRSSAYAPGASRPIVRGLSGPRVLVLQNGVGLVDASTLSPDHAVAAGAEDAARIEVLRGPSTLAYGGAAIGGVVNIIDERIPTRRPEGSADGRVAASYGSVDDAGAVSGAVRFGAGPFVVALDGAHRRSGDYATPVPPVSDAFAAAAGVTPAQDHVQRNTGVDFTSYGAGASYIAGSGYLGASIKRLETTYGIPFAQLDGPPDPDKEGPVAIRLEQTRVDLRGERQVAFGPFNRIRLAVGWADYEHAEISAETGEIGTRFLSDGVEGRLELVHGGHAGHQSAAGLQGLTRVIEAIGEEAFIPRTRVGESGVFALQRYDRDRWGLEAGVRLDRRTLSADLAGRPTSAVASSFGTDWAAAPQDRDFTNVSASAGLFWRPRQGWFLALAAAHNQRAPTEFELFADGPHAGTGAYELGDPTLGLERATSLEATARFSGGRLRLEAHAYVARYDGFIDESRTGLFADEDGEIVADGAPVVRFTQTGARFAGAEAEAAWTVLERPRGALDLEFSGDLVRGSTDLGPPARMPPWSVTAALAWRGDLIDARLEARHVAAQRRLAAFELPTESYLLLNAEVQVRPFAGRDLRFFIAGSNLTDEEAREHASFQKDIAVLPGRNVRFGLAASF